MISTSLLFMILVTLLYCSPKTLCQVQRPHIAIVVPIRASCGFQSPWLRAQDVYSDRTLLNPTYGFLKRELLERVYVPPGVPVLLTPTFRSHCNHNLR